MPNLYSLSGFGCSPFANATICNAFQSCPSTTACVLANGSGNYSDLHSVYKCVTPSGLDFGQSSCSCKPGPPLPPSTTLKNVLILGDSISLGYTPAVQAGLADVALVQHGPWSGDGGAEESAYAVQCTLTYWLRSPSGQAVHWDVIYFNNGMHSTGLQGAPWLVPGQSGAPAAYPAELDVLTAGLVAYAAASGSKLIFGLTSPFLNNATIDASISATLNPAAAAIMASHGVSTVNLYSAVVAKCGAVPQAECFGLVGCFSPHCNDQGYAYLADTVISPAIRAALQGLA
jgi:acyl-CoA thioesterase-1